MNPERSATKPAASPGVASARSQKRDIAETARRIGLAIVSVAALARFTWPGEAHDEIGSGQGLGWVLIVLLGWSVAAAGGWIGGRFRFRFAWVDVAIAAFFTLVALSAGRAAEGRVAQNLAWDWVGVGLTYLAVRWLAIERGEPRAWVIALVAIGFALALYGAYQVGVLQPETRRLYLENPAVALREAGLPDEPVARRQFEDRLLGSLEPTSVFALANSLAGFLLVPVLVVGGGLLVGKPAGRRGGRWPVALPLLLVMLGILVLTKSRSAYLGLAVGTLILVGRFAGSRRQAVIGLAGVSAVISVLAAAAWRLGQLDRLVLTESFKSLSYRWEYFVGAGNILLREPDVWWSGLGPGNFGGPYLRHKLERASESISDPHNLFLEVWTTAGLGALLVLIAALAFFAWVVARPSDMRDTVRPDFEDENPAPRLWLWGVGVLLLAVGLRPDLGPFSGSANPFEGDLPRWLILAAGWLFAAPLTRRVIAGIENRGLSACLAAGVLAMVVNLLAAGGIGFAPVALMLWVAVALALNLREGRPCGMVREATGRAGVMGLLIAAAALAGTFLGTMVPYWQLVDHLDAAEAETLMARAQMQSPSADAYARAEPHYRAAAERLRVATGADRLAATPWLRWASLELENWEASGRPTDFSHLVWHRIEDQLTQAAMPPRDPRNALVPATGMRLAARVLAAPGWPDSERQRIIGDRLRLARESAAWNPTGASVHADHAEAAWAANKVEEAEAAARRALKLDAGTPHVDKKLPRAVRARLEKRLEFADGNVL